MSELYNLSSPIRMRWANAENVNGVRHAGGISNFGRKGSPGPGTFKAGECKVLVDSNEGPGLVRRLWLTFLNRNPMTMRGIVIRIYWDGADTPAVEAPIGDFFCCPLGRNPVFESAWFSNHEQRCYLSYLPMPFRKGFKVTLTNESPVDALSLFYQVDFTLGDPIDASAGYLHAGWRRENPTILRRDFEVLPRVEGRGRYLGANFGMIAHGPCWWGEGEIKIYLDGDTDHPTLCGTGTEDYVNTAWGQRHFVGQWAGSPVADTDRRQWAFYRHHGPDPIYFEQHCRVTIQQIGFAFHHELGDYMAHNKLDSVVLTGNGSRTMSIHDVPPKPLEPPGPQTPGGLFERRDDWCATAYLYLDSVEQRLPPIAPYEHRVLDLTGDPVVAKRQDA